MGSGSHLSALIALNDLRARTVDLDWRLRSNYSRNVDPTLQAVRDNCRQLFWVDVNGRTTRAVEGICESASEFFEATPTGIVTYPQSDVGFYRCRIPR
jgi:hypothetical protein